MKIAFSSSITDYIEKVEALLLKKEASNNLMLGLIEHFKTTITKDAHFGYMEENGEVLYAFMQTPPNNWILADVDGMDDRAAEQVATFLYKKAMKVPGVLGPISQVERFVEEWKKHKKVKASVHMNQLIYQLDKVNTTPSQEGILRNAEKADHELIKSWLIQFGKEANEAMSEIKASQMATKYIENKTMYLWEVNGEAVSMVNQSRRTKHGATINAVFTPNLFKRKGYATSAVAAISQKLLDEGYQFCSLYTDRDNPTSNSIYRKIGYDEVGSSVVYEFS
ncbi:GNAT family N-acetyltransferase [Oceanobacillus halophilus]|uniref:GNAT family N-acetyltransferase n=1 Tax=Oceanobacillus halophilus TaxID=930130 RepID=A0A494ZY16_9BACI|nr:GNAT family N-acetyltransferase [Oceanobacillus halophilus]RKQ31509.1 GNAT family N-acetyltransferase [Oceanobacillus halophilus]